MAIHIHPPRLARRSASFLGPLRRREEGSALVETALSITILLTFLFGVLEVSLMLYTYHFISEAAREGTRFAIVRGSKCNGVFPSACPAADTDIEAYVKNLGFPGIDSSKMTVLATFSPYPTSKTCSPCNNAGNLVTVHVTYRFPFSIPFVPANTFTMSSTSAMIITN